MDYLRERGVDLASVRPGAKSVVTVVLPHESQRHILTYPGTISELRFEDLDLDYLASARHFHLSSLFLQLKLLPPMCPSCFAAGLTTSLGTNDGGRRFSASAIPVTVIDAVSAGDGFDAGFLHEFLRGSDITSCLAYGNLCGALSTTGRGGTEAFLQ